jgi:hypothetical protein
VPRRRCGGGRCHGRRARPKWGGGQEEPALDEIFTILTTKSKGFSKMIIGHRTSLK